MTSIYSDFGFDRLAEWMRDNELEIWADTLPEQVANGLSSERFGDLPGWLQALDCLPKINANKVDLSDGMTVFSNDISRDENQQLRKSLEAMIPWRKGPFSLCNIDIDTEWRSDKKWDRIKNAISPLKNRLVLDVGCGNGYHMWRMVGQHARRVIGVDPSPRFSVQFEMTKRIAGSHHPVDLVPIPLESVPPHLEVFDSVFSMGVLYHRRSPIDHLVRLKECLRPGGELVLESLVIKGSEQSCLVPEGRYGKMRNVWFIPSSMMMMLWLKKTGFTNIRMVDETPTLTNEQRSTDWMKYESLSEFLMPDDSTKTIEGYPAPIRAVIIAEKPH